MVLLGYSDKETVKIDWDECSLDFVKKYSLKACKKFNLEGFIILLSSQKKVNADFGEYTVKSYHTVFNKPVSWEKNVKIMSWLSLISNHYKLMRYTLVQIAKGSSTLRITPKTSDSNPKYPKIVFVYGKTDKCVARYIKTREMLKKLFESYVKTIKNQKNKGN